MIQTHAGYISDRILLLGREESCVYLVNGGASQAILGGGSIHIIPELIEQLEQFDIDETKIKQLIVLHSHFDHCGIVSYCQRRWPWLSLAASRRSKELMVSTRYIQTVDRLNRVVLEGYHRQKLIDDLDLSFTGLDVDCVLTEGDVQECGDLTLQILEVPGHSSCSIAVYIPQLRAMFASDATGIPFGDDVFTTANSNYDQYQKSLRRIMDYDIVIHMTEHYGARTGRDARRYLERSLTSAEQTRKILENSLKETGDIEKSVQHVSDLFMAKAPNSFLPRDVMEIVVRQMLNYLYKSVSG